MAMLYLGKRAKITHKERMNIVNWLDKQPTVDWYYCRSTPTYQNKNFLQDFASEPISGNSWVVKCSIVQQGVLQRKSSVFILRKDQCGTCVSFKHGNMTGEQYQEHIEQKDAAWNEKAKDKESANEKKICLDYELTSSFTMSKNQGKLYVLQNKTAST